MAGADSGLIPIVVGVTGHRKLRAEDRPSLERAVRRFFDSLRRHFPHTPLLVVSPMAEGADRLAARIGLEFGASLVAALPLSREEYEQDFPDTRAEFAELHDHERTVHRLSMPALGSRELQYELVGTYVARHSHVLLALWDGGEAEGAGGTGQIAAAQLGLSPQPFAAVDSPLDPVVSGPVYQVVTPREGRTPPDDAFAGRWLAPAHAPKPSTDGSLPASLRATFARIEAFNSDAARFEGRSPGTVKASEKQLAAGPLENLPDSLSALRHAFALADGLASRFQGETYRVMWTIYGLAMLAVVCFQLYAHAFPANDVRVVIFLGGYVALLGVADIVYLVTRHRRSQAKFQDYRALAEGLRVQFYWRLAGLEHSVADFYLRKQRDELAWIREAMRAFAIRTEPFAGADLHVLASGWVDDQRSYYTRSAARERMRLARYRSMASGVIVASLLWVIPSIVESVRGIPGSADQWPRLLQLPLLSVSLVVAWHLGVSGAQLVRGMRTSGAQSVLAGARTFVVSAVLGGLFLLGVSALAGRAHARWPEVASDRHTWSVVALTLITVAAALIASISDRRGFGEHARQYARMADSFDHASKAAAVLLAAGNTEPMRALAIELGREALSEHGDWLMLHRERPIKLPKV